MNYSTRLSVFKRLVGAFTVSAVVLTPVSALALANPTPDQHWPAPYGGQTVNAVVAASDGSYYVAGTFTDYGTSYGNAVLADATTGAAQNSFPDVDGDVFVTIPDGLGGWFIGGNFNRVGTLQRKDLAHIFASGLPDSGFDAAMNTGMGTPKIYALAVDSADGILYVGGDFAGGTTFSGVSAVGLVILNAGNGAPSGSVITQPTFGGGTSTVLALAADEANNFVYAGGNFSSANATTRNNLAGFTSTGALTSWDPDVNNIVSALALTGDGNTIYAGGSFTDVNSGTTRRHAAAMTTTLSAGTATGFNPNVSSDVYALALDEPNGLLYMGGAFNGVNGGSNRSRLAVVNSSTGLVSSGSFEGFTNDVVLSIALTADGSTLYAVGPFTNENGGLQNHIGAAAWNTGDSQPTAAFSQETQLNTYSISLNDTDDAVLIGSYDATLGGNKQYRADGEVYSQPFGQPIVLHILAGGTVDPAFAPHLVDDTIYAMALSPDEQTLYIGGEFLCADVFLACLFGPAERNHLAALDADDGTLLPFDPDVNGTVLSLAVSHDVGGDTLYAGGDFSTVNQGGTPATRTGLAAFTTADGVVTSFDADISGGTSNVLALALTADDSVLYIGGDFSAFYGPTFRNNLAAATTAGTGAAVMTFNPDVADTVRALALSGDENTLYAGGDFTDVNSGTTRNYAAAFETTGGVATDFDPDADARVNAIAIGPDGIVYLGGEFDSLGATSHEYIVAVDPDNGSTEGGFDANLEGFNDAVYALAHGGTGNGLLAGGKFNQSFNDPSGDEIPYVATVNLAHYGDTATPTPMPTPTPGGGGGHSSGGGGGFLPGVTPTPTPFPTLTPVPTSTPVGDPANLARYGLHEGDVIGARAAGDPDVYIVNEWGYKRLFLNPVIFSFYGHLGFSKVKGIIPPGRDAFPTSGLFRNCEANDPKVYAVEVTGEDTGLLHHVSISGEAAVAQDPYFFRKVFCINNREFNWYPKSPVPYTSLSQIPPYTRR